MRLDHISYVTTHEQLADTVQRLGALIGSGFIDGGIHPRFGTRNFTCALKNRQYIEVVCPLDHPATDETPWGRAVKKKANEGGGWFTWVFSTENISQIEKKLGRQAVEGHRVRPNGSDLKWKQIGVNEIAETPEFPFFIQWLSNDHPSQDGFCNSAIEKIVISDESQLSGSWFKDDIFSALNHVQMEWIKPRYNEGDTGIVSVQFIRDSIHTVVI